MLKNNIIAIIAISFVTVGALWGIGNLLNPPEESTLGNVSGILLVAQNNVFNETNPDVQVKVNVPIKLTVLNKDFVRHDLVVDKTADDSIVPINTFPLRPEQDFKTAILAKKAGEFEYYCSLHPALMRGKIIATAGQ